ncbi:NBAS subunit of NRZ tethering complex-like [Clytia hemisphaerica]|uniref:NBAS subunit of NRZ tethering complex-like n=1 Tax=Clytia hemisphaerica TaxID=252671 RepID=UPI0034D6EB97
MGFYMLIQLSNLLQICGHDNKERIGQVNIKIAESAFEHKDYTYAGIVCVQLVDDNYSNAWYICRKLGECAKYTNFTIRQKLLSFALPYCPVHHIEEVLQEKTQLETQVLYERLGVFTKEGKKDKIVTSSKKETEEENNEDNVDGNNISILNKTKTTTKKLISSVASVADNCWVGSAMNWVKPSSEGSGNQVDVVEREIESVRHNPFYSSLDSKKIDEDVQRFNLETKQYGPINNTLLKRPTLPDQKGE